MRYLFIFLYLSPPQTHPDSSSFSYCCLLFWGFLFRGFPGLFFIHVFISYHLCSLSSNRGGGEEGEEPLPLCLPVSLVAHLSVACTGPPLLSFHSCVSDAAHARAPCMGEESRRVGRTRGHHNCLCPSSCSVSNEGPFFFFSSCINSLHTLLDRSSRGAPRPVGVLKGLL